MRCGDRRPDGPKPGLPRDLGRIIHRCLEKDSGKRFQTVRDDPRFLALLDDMRADLDRQRRALERDGLAIAE